VQTVANGVLTNYEVVNPKAKKTALLLHGWAHNASLWLPLAKLLSKEYCYYLLDLPGFGGTKNLSLNSDVPEYTLFVKSFVDKLKLKNFILIGHSFGGQIAGDFVLNFPKLIDRLFLIGAAVIRVRGPVALSKIFIAKIFRPLIKFFPLDLANQILKRYAPDSSLANEYQKSVLNRTLKYNLKMKLHLIKVPTEIVWGSEDRVIPYVGTYLVENIHAARLHIVYEAGHNIHLTHTAELAAILNQILTL